MDLQSFHPLAKLVVVLVVCLLLQVAVVSLDGIARLLAKLTSLLAMLASLLATLTSLLVTLNWNTAITVKLLAAYELTARCGLGPSLTNVSLITSGAARVMMAQRLSRVSTLSSFQDLTQLSKPASHPFFHSVIFAAWFIGKMMLKRWLKAVCERTGKLKFTRTDVVTPAQWVQVVRHEDDIKAGTFDQSAKRLLHLLTKTWDIKPPSVLISVTGGARHFDLPKELRQAFESGLDKVSRTGNAWLITGGTDSGVMKLTGEALPERMTAIGICPWGVISGRDALLRAEGEPAQYVNFGTEPLEGGFKRAALEHHHSHFLLYDSEPGCWDHPKLWGTEIPLRNAVEKALCEHFDVPRVLVVVNGGPGTLKTVLESLEHGCPVVLLAGSGGAAAEIANFMRQEKETPNQVHTVRDKAFDTDSRREELASIVKLARP